MHHEHALLECDSCNSTMPALPLPHRVGNLEVLCPTCTARTALTDAAWEHLHALLTPTVTAWAQHWAAAGMDAQALSDILNAEGTYWHPHGALARPSEGNRAAAQVIGEALTCE
ncbi:hypothetical protein [Deinococcus sp. PEB2-63]